MRQMTATAPSRPRWRTRLSAAAVFVVAAAEMVSANGSPLEQPEIGTRVVKVLRVDGLLFKDLDKNGTLDAYEDWRRPIDERVQDLVGRMQVEEKAGLMVGPSLQMGPGGTPSEQPTYGVNPFAGGPPALVSPATKDALYNRHIVQFINRENVPPRTMATWLNSVQELAEGRLFQPFPQIVDSGKAWWFVCPPASASRPKTRAFEDWLVEELSAPQARSSRPTLAATGRR